MSDLGYLAVILIIPVSGLIIAAVMLRIVDRDARPRGSANRRRRMI